jgi:hypothetical protein
MCRRQVLQKLDGLLALQMLKRTANKAFQVKMITASAILTNRLIVARGRARLWVSSVKALQHALTAKRVKLAVERAFGDRLAPLRRREMRTQLVGGELPIRILLKKAKKQLPRSGLVGCFWHSDSSFP